MSKGLIGGLIVLVIVVILGFMIGGSYNSLVNKQEEVNSKEATIDTMLERRADLIPNLVSTAKGFMNHEEEIFTKLTNARDAVLNADSIQDKANANNALTSALSDFRVIVEDNPELQSQAAITSLMDELAGAENRISTARKDYNDAVKDYNSATRKFPQNMIASMFGFKSEVYFEVSEGKTDTPKVDFD